jgi:2-dehydro-3-deoxygluconokinase
MPPEFGEGRGDAGQCETDHPRRDARAGAGGVMAGQVFLAIGEAMIEFSGSASHGWKLGFAGDTLNTAWYARALLPPEWQVAYGTRIGRDRYSDQLAAFLQSGGISTAFLQRDDRRLLGLYLIELEGGERSFTYWRDSSAARHLADDVAALDAAIGAAEVVYFSGITLAILAEPARAEFLRLVAAATARGALTCFDPNIRPRLWPDPGLMRRDIAAAAAASALVLPSFSDEAAAFGDADPAATAARYAALGCREVVVKDGERPTLILEAGATTIVQPTPVEAVDTTGAGDSFNGAYLAARLVGASPQAAARQAHRVAGLVVRRHGAIVAQHEVAALTMAAS